jgi:hypothetical protein
MYDKIPENTRRHWTAYHSVCQDPVDWLEKGKQDFIVPMMYYSGNLFFPFVTDWMSKSNGRFVVPGLGLFQMDQNESGWEADVLLEQLQFCRDNQTDGNAFFRARHLIDNKKGILEAITSRFYTKPALLPALNWINAAQPKAPSSISAQKNGNFLQLDWDKAPQTKNQPVFYNLYRSETYPVDTENADHLIATRLPDNHYEIPIDNQIESGYYYVVTSYDRYHNESSYLERVYFVTGDFDK